MKYKKIIATMMAIAMLIGATSEISSPVVATMTVEDAVTQSVES